jgi:hypothetical protein
MAGTTLAAYVPWLWLAAGILMVALEIALPGLFFLWFGIAAIAVGLMVLAGLDGVHWQVLAFAGVSAVMVVVGRVVALRGAHSDDPGADLLNERGRDYVGRQVPVVEAIVDGRGRVRIGDTIWLAEGPDAAVGTVVRVTGTRGTVVLVAPP